MPTKRIRDDDDGAIKHEAAAEETEFETLSTAERSEIAKDIFSLAEGSIKRAVDEVHRQLDEKLDEGLNPGSEKVQALERALDEKQAELDAALGKISDQMRLLEAHMRGIGRVTGSTRVTDAPDHADYKGTFMTPERHKAIIAEYSRGDPDRIPGYQARAADTTAIASSGKLPIDVADAFIDLIIQEQAMLSKVTTRRMISPEARLDQLFVNKRQIVAATENTAPTVANAIGFRGSTLSTKEVIWAEDITLSFLEDNIERANAENHIAGVLARQFGTDLNDLGWNGDTGGAGNFIPIVDGFAKLINTDPSAPTQSGAGSADTGDGVDQPTVVTTPGAPAGTTPVAALFRLIHKALPERHKARSDYGFFVPTGTAELYADEVQQRETALGDNVLINGLPSLRYFGRSVWPEPHLPPRVFLTPVQLMFFGILRNMRVDSEFQPRKRAVEYTITARIGYQITGYETFVRLSADLPAGFL